MSYRPENLAGFIPDPCADCSNKRVDEYGYLCDLGCGGRTAYLNKLAGADAMLEALEFKGVVYIDGEWVRLALDTGMDKDMRLNGRLICIPEESDES